MPCCKPARPAQKKLAVDLAGLLVGIRVGVIRQTDGDSRGEVVVFDFAVRKTSSDRIGVNMDDTGSACQLNKARAVEGDKPGRL